MHLAHQRSSATPEERIASACDFVQTSLVSSLPSRDRHPSRLHEAMWAAVIPGGKRLRSLLVVLTAEACAREQARCELVGRFAAAVELVHCASLVHDDLPCFDDAPTRRGRPTCHVAHGEATALLVGDALIVQAFEVLGRAPTDYRAALRLVALLAEHTGSVRGIIGGQALELEPAPELAEYHARKTAALFRVAAAGAAIAVGRDDDQLRYAQLGELIGEVLQLRDDLDDATADPDAIGKPVGRDAALARPNAVNAASAAAVVAKLRDRLSAARALLDDSDAASPLVSVLARAAGSHAGEGGEIRAAAAGRGR